MRSKRNSTVLSFAVLFTLLLSLLEGQAQSFNALPEATRFLDKVLADGDRKALTSALAVPDKSHLSKYPVLFDTLQNEWKRTGAFTELYKGRQFPVAGNSFTLGGHDSELGHLHIVFAREGAAWKINDIWMCR